MAQVYLQQFGSSCAGEVGEFFERIGGAQQFIKSSGEVFIKVNAVDSQPHTFTSPEFTVEVVKRFRDAGAEKVAVIENSTQGNYTRLVFDAIGMTKAVRQAGGEVVYLDEQPVRQVNLGGGPYAEPRMRFPATILYLIGHRDEVTYVNLPKFKTHSMTDLSLGLKNQWGFPIHDDRIADHNFRLHEKIAAINDLITPDLTIIEGREAVVHGHFPPTALAEECLVDTGIMIGGTDVIAVDMVGARVLGFDPEAVEHIRLAADRRAEKKGRQRLQFADIEINGKLPRPLTGQSSLIDKFPAEVEIVAGKERSCREGCRGNPLATLQIIAFDFGGQGEFRLVFGKGHDEQKILAQAGDIMLAGDCAIAELGPHLLNWRKGRVFVSSGCNNLAETIIGISALLNVSFKQLIPMGLAKSLFDIVGATVNRSTSNIPPLRPVRLSHKRIERARRSFESIESSLSPIENG